jgi:hypothetical protein
MKAVKEERKSGPRDSANGAENMAFTSAEVGQFYPHHYPHQADFDQVTGDPLGEPMTIGQIGRLLGCSTWTVRQRYLPLGLPYFRIGRTGKLMFYRKQVVHWILEKQKKKGGNRP